jgi:serine/threonine protein kinase
MCSDGIQQQQQRAQQPWQVAVKCLLPAAWDGKYIPQEQQRHRTEFTVMSALGERKAPHILTLLAEGVLVRGQQKLVCVVTELQQGSVYSALCSKKGLSGELCSPFSEQSMQHVARQTLQALQGIAEAGVLGGFTVVHRDLKCANLLLTGGGDVVLADFGTSSYQKLAEGSAAELLHELIGTPYHMSPAVFGGAYGPEVDLFALGNCIVEMVSVNQLGRYKDLRDLGCEWEFGAGGQAAWVDWLRRFVRGEEKQKLPGVQGHGMGKDSLRGFVEACCFLPAAAAEPQQDAWSAHRDRLRSLLQHPWLQPAAV